MSDDAETNNEPPENQSGSEPQNSGGTPPETEPETAPANEPDWAAGKSREDLIKQTSTLMQTVGNGPQNHQQNQPQQQNPQPQSGGWQQQPRNTQGQFQSPQQQQPAGNQQQLQGPPSPDLFYEDKAEYRRQMQQWTQQNVQQGVQQATQQFQPMIQNMGQSARMIAKQDPDVSDVFQEYEPEIVAQVQNIPPQNRTVDAWKMAAEMVAGRHRHELADKRAQELAAQTQPSPTNRQGGGPAGGGQPSFNDAIDRFWHESDSDYISFCKERDVTPADLRSRAAAMDVTPEEFVNIIQKDTIVKSPTGISASGV